MKVSLSLIVMATSFLTSCNATSEHEIINESVRSLTNVNLGQMASCQIALESVLMSSDLENAPAEVRQSFEAIQRFWEDAVVFHASGAENSVTEAARKNFKINEQDDILDNCLTIAEKTMDLYDAEVAK